MTRPGVTQNLDWKIGKEGGINLSVPIWLKQIIFTESRERNITVNEVCRRLLVVGLCRKMESDFTVPVRQLEAEAHELI